MSDDRYSRQESMLPTEILAGQHILIIGLGAVGREVARTLTCNGVPQITMFDFDTVEEHNCVTQGYHNEDIGKLKTDATAEEMLRINPDIKINAVGDRWRPTDERKIAKQYGEYTTIFSCVDDLSMRGKIFSYYHQNDTLKLLLDCRIGLQQLRLLSVFDDDSKKHYPSTITSDETAFAHGCHVPMIKHCATIGACMLVQQYIAALNGKELFMDRTLSLGSSELFNTNE